MKTFKEILIGIFIILVGYIGVLLMGIAIYSGIDEISSVLAVLVFLFGLALVVPVVAILCGIIGGVDVFDFWFNDHK